MNDNNEQIFFKDSSVIKWVHANIVGHCARDDRFASAMCYTFENQFIFLEYHVAGFAVAAFYHEDIYWVFYQVGNRVAFTMSYITKYEMASVGEQVHIATHYFSDEIIEKIEKAVTGFEKDRQSKKPSHMRPDAVKYIARVCLQQEKKRNRYIRMYGERLAQTGIEVQEWVLDYKLKK